eukprot:974985_1
MKLLLCLTLALSLLFRASFCSLNNRLLDTIHEEKDFKKLIEIVPELDECIRKHVYDHISFLEPNSYAFKVYEKDFPIWIREEETASTLWTSLGKEHIFH